MVPVSCRGFYCDVNSRIGWYLAFISVLHLLVQYFWEQFIENLFLLHFDMIYIIPYNEFLILVSCVSLHTLKPII